MELEKKVLTREEERELIRRIKEKGDDKARDEFISLNLRLAYGFVEKFVKNMVL